MIDPYEILGINSENASDESIRKAYLQAIRNNPPDRDSKAFERIQNAFNLISSEQKRIRLELFGFDNDGFLDDCFPAQDDRPKAGMDKWLAMMEEESKRSGNGSPYGSE